MILKVVHINIVVQKKKLFKTDFEDEYPSKSQLIIHTLLNICLEGLFSWDEFISAQIGQ